MRERIIGFLVEILELDMGENVLNSDTNLIELGLDSLKAIELIVQIEDDFNITFLEDDLLVDNLSTIENIEKLVSTYVGMKEN